jgi:arylsulfatase A-like enzyme
MRLICIEEAKLGHFSHFCKTKFKHFQSFSMLKIYIALLCFSISILNPLIQAQSKSNPKLPKAVIVISYDQMRGDYPESFSRFWGNRGFNRIMKEGAYSPLCHFNHVSNMTCPGHAVLLTGSYPSLTGIVSNDFFDSPSGCICYCTEDKKHPVKGNPSIGRSPELLKQLTLGDVLQKKHPKSKGLAIALKDRSAILMAGRNPQNTVLWFDWKTQNFTTSSYYTQPSWLDDLNRTLPYTAYAGKVWRTIIPDSISYEDSVIVEGNFPGGNFTFPHEIGVPGQQHYTEAMLTSPFGISYLFESAKFAIKNNEIGNDEITDIVSIGVSTTDFLGHTFGPDSREIQELYIHADSILGDFLDHLDQTIGKQNYLVVIASDHGVSPIPEYITRFGKVPVDAGRINEKTLKETLEKEIGKKCGQKENATWIKYIEPPSIFLNDTTILSSGYETNMIVDTLCTVLSKIDGIAHAVPTSMIQQGLIPPGWTKELLEMYRNDIHPDRTGEIMFMVKPYWLFGSKPASHGTPYDYDTHVPLMFFGGGISPMQIQGKTDPADIVPTLAHILQVNIQHRHGKNLELIKLEPTKTKSKKKKSIR